MTYAVGIRTDRRDLYEAPLVVVARVVDRHDGAPIVAVGTGGLAHLGAHDYREVDDLDEVRPAAVELLGADIALRLAALVHADLLRRDSDGWHPRDGWADYMFDLADDDAAHYVDGGARLILDADAATLFAEAGVDPTAWRWTVSPARWDDRAA